VRQGDKPQHSFFEIWSHQRLLAVKDLKADHRQVLINRQFGSAAWSHDEQTILYVAEKLRAEENSVWDSDHDIKGIYREHLGETLTDVSDPGLFVFHWADMLVQGVSVPADVFPAYPAFHPTDPDFVFVGYQKMPCLLGLADMLNRPTRLYQARLGQDPVMIPIPQELLGVLCPKFNTADKLLLYGVPQSLAHSTCLTLLLMDWTTYQISTLVPVYETSQPNFSGLFSYHANLLRGGWLTNDEFIFESPHRANSSVFTTDLAGVVTEIALPVTKPYSAQILDVYGAEALVEVSTLTTLPQVYRYCAGTRQLQLVEANIPQASNSDEGEILGVIGQTRTNILLHRNTDIESVLYWINSDAPLVVSIHGGPHSSASCGYNPSRVALLLLGYNVLNVNYRGSTGFGRRQVEALLGNAGSLDLQDVMQAVEEARALVDTTRLVSLGISHGGALSAHLSAAVRCAASIVISGVIDIFAMTYAADITDWTFAEALNSPVKYPMSEADALLMYHKSPVSQAGGVVGPTLIIVGGSDLNVPSALSYEWYRLLKGLGKDVKFMVFPDEGHTFTTPSSVYESTACQLVWLTTKVPSSPIASSILK
jgi:acylaminoacyl-peptidase